MAGKGNIRMNLLKILAGTIFNLLGLMVMYKGVKTIRSEGIKAGFIDIIIGLGFVLIGLLIWTGFIS
jgi:putative Ca2+/H+ antiporter (TMEM165/GDT1 family)